MNAVKEKPSATETRALWHGQWWSKVPKDPLENLKFRRYLLAKVKRDKSGRLIEEIKHVCKEDIKFYVNVFCWLHEPRNLDKGKCPTLPFVTWPYQDGAFDEMVDCVRTGQELVIEKARDMGASWICLTTFEWFWHFHEGLKFLMISRKKELVDDKYDSDSLFWKIDEILRRLPGWLTPKFLRRDRSIYNEDNGSQITGDTTTGAAGVGGRATAMLIDEYSRFEPDIANEIYAGSRDTTRCRIFNFTPMGTGHPSYRLLAKRPSLEEDPIGGIRKIRFDYWKHPEKGAGLYRWDKGKSLPTILDTKHVFPAKYEFVHPDPANERPWGQLRSVWFDEEDRIRANRRYMAQMVEINYQSSDWPFFGAELLAEIEEEYTCPPVLIGDVECDQETGTFKRFVPKEHGTVLLWVNLDPAGNPPRSKYGAGADVSYGKGATNSCLSIVDAVTGEKVLEYATPWAPIEKFAPQCLAIVRWFCDARFVWESQGPGDIFGKIIWDLGYRNVRKRRNESSTVVKETDSLGWVPTVTNRINLLGQYVHSLTMHDFINRSKMSIAECRCFKQQPNGDIVHEDTLGVEDPTKARINHGDRVIADALADLMRIEIGGGSRSGQDLTPEIMPGTLAWRHRLWEEEQRLKERWV